MLFSVDSSKFFFCNTLSSSLSHDLLELKEDSREEPPEGTGLWSPIISVKFQCSARGAYSSIIQIFIVFGGKHLLRVGCQCKGWDHRVGWRGRCGVYSCDSKRFYHDAHFERGQSLKLQCHMVIVQTEV